VNIQDEIKDAVILTEYVGGAERRKANWQKGLI
jgi:hypothetical protein